MKNNPKYYQLLPWDSKLFGYSVAKISKNIHTTNLCELLESLKDKKVRLAYCFIDPLDKRLNAVAISANGMLVDEKVTYVLNSSVIVEPDENNSSIHSYTKKILSPKLISLALQSGMHSRFFIDKNFTHNEYKKLYTVWLKKSVLHKIALDVLVYESSRNNIEGFITLELKKKNVSIGLLAVDKDSRGKSIGKLLVTQALINVNKRGYRKMYVTTQGKNLIACHFFEKLGFLKFKSEKVYHFWL